MRREKCRRCQGQGKILEPVIDGVKVIDLRKVVGLSRAPIELIRVDCPDCHGRGDRV